MAVLILTWSAGGRPASAQDHMGHGGTLPHGIPDFCAVPTRTSAGSGVWSNVATWGGTLPGPDDVVVIGMGHNVTLVDMSAEARVLCIEGSLAFARNENTRLKVGTLLIKHEGNLEVGTPTAPIDADKTAEIVIANAPLNNTDDPGQFGTGILSVGKTTMHGAMKTPTWVRLAAEPHAGSTALTLEGPVNGWRQGDRVILPDTRHLKFNELDGTGWTRSSPQWEELTVASISDDGKVITLLQPLQFDHLGARDADGVLRLLPHVGNLSRNVIIRSQEPIGSPGVQGHVLFTERAEVDIRYTELLDLGRTRAEETTDGTIDLTSPNTNQIGRYAMHFHHLMGPVVVPASGHPYTFVGNAIDGGSTNHNRRWGMAIHNTHYGLVSDNVAYNYAGALINTEDGSESYNVIERNFVMRGSGTGGRLGRGNEGMGFWFRGPNNYVRGNVAADLDSDAVESAYGFKFFMHGACPGCSSLAEIKIPTAPGQDMSEYVTVDGNALPILQFENNEVYSAAEGLTYWWLSSRDPIPSANPRPSVFKDLRIWHVYNIGIYHYPGARVLFDGLKIFGEFGVDNPDSKACCGRGFHGEDYAATDIRIVNAEIHNMWTGIVPSAAGTGLQVVENSSIRGNLHADIGIDTMFSSNGPDWLPPRKIILNNVRMGSAKTISKDWSPRLTSNTMQTDQLLVYGYQNVPADNFEVFYLEQ